MKARDLLGMRMLSCVASLAALSQPSATGGRTSAAEHTWPLGIVRPDGPGQNGQDQNGQGQTAPPVGTTAPTRRARTAVAGNMTYHGGPVMHTNTVYLIFWAPPARAASSRTT